MNTGVHMNKIADVTRQHKGIHMSNSADARGSNIRVCMSVTAQVRQHATQGQQGVPENFKS